MQPAAPQNTPARQPPPRCAEAHPTPPRTTPRSATPKVALPPSLVARAAHQQEPPRHGHHARPASSSRAFRRSAPCALQPAIRV